MLVTLLAHSASGQSIHLSLHIEAIRQDGSVEFVLPGASGGLLSGKVEEGPPIHGTISFAAPVVVWTGDLPDNVTHFDIMYRSGDPQPDATLTLRRSDGGSEVVTLTNPHIQWQSSRIDVPPPTAPPEEAAPPVTKAGAGALPLLAVAAGAVVLAFAMKKKRGRKGR